MNARINDKTNVIQTDWIKLLAQLIYSRKTSQKISHTRQALMSCIFVWFGIMKHTHRVGAHQIFRIMPKLVVLQANIIIARFWYCCDCHSSRSSSRWFLCRQSKFIPIKWCHTVFFIMWTHCTTPNRCSIANRFNGPFVLLRLNVKLFLSSFSTILL